MLKVIMAAGALALSGSGALAQAISPTNTGSMSSMDTGTTPIAVVARNDDRPELQ